MVRAVFTADIVDDLLTAADTEVDIDIRHGDPLRIQESLEIETVFHGFHVGDVQAVGHYAPCSGATPGSHGDAAALGIADEVGDNEEIVYKPHLADHIHLIAELLQIFRRLLRVAALEAVQAEPFKIGVPVGISLRQLEFRQVVRSELELHITEIRHPLGILNGLRALREKRAHFRLAFDVELLCFKFHSAGIVHGFAHLDAHEHILGDGVGPTEIVGVVGGHQRDAGILVKAQQTLHDLGIFRKRVILELQIIAIRAKEFSHCQGLLLRRLILSVPEEAGDLPCQAGRQGNQPLVVLPQQVLVNAGPDIKAFGKAPGHHMAEIPVADLIAAQKDEMPGAAVHLVHLVKPGPGRHIDLAANDGLDPLGLAGLIKVHRPVHDAVVGDGHGGLSQFPYAPYQSWDPAAAVQKRIFRVDVKMGKSHGEPPVCRTLSSGQFHELPQPMVQA